MENNRKNGEINSSGRVKFNTQDNEGASPYRKNGSNLNSTERHGGDSPGMRKVSKSHNKNTKRTYNSVVRMQNELTEAEKHRKIERQRKEERLKRQRMQALVGLGAAVIVAIVLIFMTPIFSIREIRLDGNYTVPKEIINDKIGYLVGANLFGTSVSKIERKMNEIPQVESVTVKKHIFPSYLDVAINECKPAAYLLSGSSTIVIDSNMRIIDDAGVFDTKKLPSVSGVSVQEYQLDEPINIDSAEKSEALAVILKAFEVTGLTNSITNISLDDLTAIKFNYDNRIEALCGSQLQLERKIRMFAETIKTETINENSIGTMDLSVPGKAVYEP